MRVLEKDNLIEIIFTNKELKTIRNADSPMSFKTKNGKVITFVTEDVVARVKYGSDKLIRRPVKDKVSDE